MANAKNAKRVESARRKLLKAVMAGSGAVAAGKLMLEHWNRPVVASVVLPAHAGLSVCESGVVSGPISGLVENNGGSLTGTTPPFSGTISGGNFSVTVAGSFPCISGAGSYNAVLTGSAGGSFSGGEYLYCDGTLVGSCSLTGAANNTTPGSNLFLSGSIVCTVCDGYINTGSTTMDTIG